MKKRRSRGGSQSLLNMVTNPQFKDGAIKARTALAKNITNNITSMEEFANILVLGFPLYVLNTDSGATYPRADLRPEHFTINNDGHRLYYFFNTIEDAEHARNQYIHFLRDNLYRS
jgi:hypothetical protein